MSAVTFAAECPPCRMLWNQRYKADQIRDGIAETLELEFWCQQRGDTFEPDRAQLERRLPRT